MNRRRFLKGTTAAAATALAGPALVRAAPERIRLTVATGHAPVVTWVSRLDGFFIPEVDRRLAEAGEYAIDWTRAYSGTVAKIGGEIDALEQQVVDVAIVGATFQPAKLPLHVVSYFTPFASPSYEAVIGTVDALNERIPAMQQMWQANRMHYLGGLGVDNFQLFMAREANGLDDLAGLKIGGIGPNLNWLKGAGVTPVQVDPPSIYNDLATGVYDGCLLPVGLASNLKANEVAPYLVSADFGAMSWGALAVNARRMSRLPEPVQAVIDEVGREYQADMMRVQEEAKVAGLERMKADGLNVVELSTDERAAWANGLPHIAREWAEPLEARGLPAKQVVTEFMAAVEERTGPAVRDWRVGL